MNKTWNAGTLVYDRWGLARLFFWIMLGDFAWMIAVTATPMMMPLYLKSISYSTQEMAWLMSMGGIIGLMIGPLAGVWSDRLRSPWGRRRPFLLISTPLNGVCSLLMPFTTAAWQLNMLVAVGSFAGSFTMVQFYFYNDVIPGDVMGRFIGTLRLIGFLGAFVFQYFMFPYFDTNPKLVWVSVGLISMIGSMATFVMVREGAYAPPPPRKKLMDAIGVYLRDGMSSAFIWCLWLTLGITMLGGVAANFYVLFFQKDIGMTTVDIGHMTAWGTVLAAMIAYPSGWLIDRLGVRKVWVASGTLVALSQLAIFFFVDNKTSCVTLYMVYYGINMIMAACLLPMIFSFLPKEKFGQLASCQTLTSQVFSIVGTNAVGSFMTWTGSYRTAFLYAGVIYLFSPLFMLAMCRLKNPFAGQMTSMSAAGAAENRVPSPVPDTPKEAPELNSTASRPCA